ncbi:hypothetical protein PSCICF_10310 [Pseudomonas cichorii]|nr:hypothetical protein PSCICF_10310 [Pseudomonas cichorii]GFM60723.1 hypothetical protein PSCICG_18830 [Pseudomonas cichorii]
METTAHQCVAPDAQAIGGMERTLPGFFIPRKDFFSKSLYLFDFNHRMARKKTPLKGRRAKQG